nr:uncharacterized protein LOC108128254 [Drosophila bipectinata]
MATLTNLSHFELFRILDYMKWNCERQNSLESVHLIKYLDIFNFALTCKKLRRIVWDWSKDIYYQLEINPLHKHLHKDMNVSFNKIHSILKRTTKKGKENINDVFIASLMKEVTLNSIELTYKPQEHITNHEEIFERYLKAIRGERSRRQFCVLNPNAVKNLGDLLTKSDIDDQSGYLFFNHDQSIKVKELILDIAELNMGERAIAKDKIILDLQKLKRLQGIIKEIKDCNLCCSEDRKEFTILSQEIILKIRIITEVKDRGRWDNIERIEYEPLDSKQKAKIRRIFMDISDGLILDDFIKNFKSLKSSIFPQVRHIIMDLAEKNDIMILGPKNVPKFKNVTINICDRRISDLGLFRHISKLSLTASFEIADLIEFCKQNQSLVSLDINVSSFADHRYLSEIADHCPLLKQLKFVLNDNAGEKEYVRLANLVRLQQLEIVKTPSHTDDMENYSDLDFEGLTPKRLRIEPENEALSGNINNTFESNVALHELLKAILAKKRSLLVNLALKFDVEDEIVQTISKIKSLRVLQCGLCDVNSITHLKDSPVLGHLSLFNKGHLISEDIVHLLKKQVNVSSLDAKMNLSQRGSLYIETNNAAIYTNINVEPLLKIKNLNCVIMSNDLFKLRGSCLVRLLEQGVWFKTRSCQMNLDSSIKELYIYYDIDPILEFPLPEVKNLKSFLFFKASPPESVLNQLIEDHAKTLEELNISLPQTLFELDKDVWLNEPKVKMLSSFTSLKYISCGLQKLKDIQHLANLTNLEKIIISSKHDPKFVGFSRFLTPVLQKCIKLNYLEIKIVPKGLTRKFLISLHRIVFKERHQETQISLEVCLTLSAKTNLTENQVGIIKN